MGSVFMSMDLGHQISAQSSLLPYILPALQVPPSRDACFYALPLGIFPASYSDISRQAELQPRLRRSSQLSDVQRRRLNRRLLYSTVRRYASRAVYIRLLTTLLLYPKYQGWSQRFQ
jgi:hypothetical protein